MGKKRKRQERVKGDRDDEWIDDRGDDSPPMKRVANDRGDDSPRTEWVGKSPYDSDDSPPDSPRIEWVGKSPYDDSPNSPLVVNVPLMMENH
ncbi:hypothetical protein CTI12_AA117300 [Artemisia annua]|uniref:Uncharacterized protein n=1 Tax=Artemisia annua TaxID=35608 RepID=A0A2U1PSI2_ARTAN|nr:hypothetical protein CTI12_AA117300 [Artemisia annua]